MTELSARDIAGYIDHTLLAANASREQIVAICEEAKKYEFKSVCVNPVWTSTVARELEGSDVLTCTVIGFPLGASATATHDGGAILKVIIETCLLTEDAKVLACEAAKAAGADFVKTSTGFSTGGATVEDVALMRRTVGPEIGVKASGGVRSLETARAMIEAGATRLGSSSGVAILEGEQSGSSY